MANSDIFLIAQDPKLTTDQVIIVENVPENGYQFDAVTKHTATYSTSLSQHPVPSGSFVSDHAVSKPLVWAMAGVLTPYNVISRSSVLSAIFRTGSFSEASDALAASAMSAIETVQRKRDQLVQFDKDHIILTIFGSDFQYPNMVITGISIPKTPDLNNAFKVAVKFQQIRIAPQAVGISTLTSVDADRLGSTEALEFAS